MSTETKEVFSPRKLQIPATLARAGTFILHYLEMFLVMCTLGRGFALLFFWVLAQAGYTNLLERFPEFTILLIGVILAIPMIAWMRFRRHEWRPTWEMASSSVILAILLVGLASFGLMQETSMLVWLKRLACPVMLIPMFLRLDHYTVSHAIHRSQSLEAHSAGEHSEH